MNHVTIKILFSFTAILAFGCTEETQYKQSVFTEDPDDPGLPVYSELAYNTFGAYYNKDTFTSFNGGKANVMIRTNTISLNFRGSVAATYPNVGLAFILPGIHPVKFTDLLALDNTTLDLKDPSYAVLISNQQVTITQGTLHILHAKNFFLDEDLVQIVLSGTFEFQGTLTGKSITMSNGRFDIGVDEDNFLDWDQ